MKSLFLFFLVLSISIPFSGCAPFPPLYTAVHKGDIKKVTKLLNEGADVNMGTSFDETLTPLHNAAFFGHIDIARLLIERGANVNAQDFSRDTPLLLAIGEGGHDDVARLLIEKGANLNSINVNGLSALGWAAIKNNPPMINLLIDRGADIDIAITGLEVLAAKVPGVIPSLAMLKKIKNEKEKVSHGKD